MDSNFCTVCNVAHAFAAAFGPGDLSKQCVNLRHRGTLRRFGLKKWSILIMLDAGTSYQLSGASKIAHILDRLLIPAVIGVVLQGDARSAFMGGLHVRSHERATGTG